MKIKEYFLHKNWNWSDVEGTFNIVYFEDSTADFQPLPERLDAWNDRRCVFTHDSRCVLNVEATTEPGKAPTLSASAKKRGGVFRIEIGQHQAKWKIGAHKSSWHLALVHAENEIYGFRDLDQNGKRTNDKRDKGVGINQHSTHRYGKPTDKVGFYSEGCLVGKNWFEHVLFMRLVMNDARYVADANNYRFDTTIIDTSDYNRWLKSNA
jgi:hypothetical protein